MAATTTTMIQQRSVIGFENRTPVAELRITRAAADATDHHHDADHHLRRQLLVVRLQVPCRNSKNHGIRGSGAVIPIESRAERRIPQLFAMLSHHRMERNRLELPELWKAWLKLWKKLLQL
jgi:hypothetical protein